MALDRRTRSARWIGPLGVASIILGLCVIAVDIPHLDAVVFSISPGNGLHLSDAIGGVAVLLGTLLVWYR
jgi:hypothetical protein